MEAPLFTHVLNPFPNAVSLGERLVVFCATRLLRSQCSRPHCPPLRLTGRRSSIQLDPQVNQGCCRCGGGECWVGDGRYGQRFVMWLE